jgi:predicted P-loop ATPase
VSQLANYREYFRYEQNANYAKEKYGIEVKDPNLVLVVGSYENSHPDQIIQACRKYDNVSVIDYDTLCQIYLGRQDQNA